MADFGDAPSDPEVVHRAEVMRRLLAKYEEEGGVGSRRLVRVLGTPVAAEVRADLLGELRAWATGKIAAAAHPSRLCVGHRSRGGALRWAR